MKVYGKYLVIGTVNGHERVASSFMTKKEAIEALDFYFTKINDNEWESSSGQKFTIKKNTEEWR